MNKTKKITAVSFSGGTNSTAMLIGLHEHGIRPDYITFAGQQTEPAESWFCWFFLCPGNILKQKEFKPPNQ